MGKRVRGDEEVQEKRGKKGKNTFTFLNVRFDSIDSETVKRHLITLIGAALITKLLVLFLTPTLFHSFVDLFDIGFYFDHVKLLLQGQLPYIDYPFDYPILIFVPLTLALIPAILFENAMVFIYSFQLLMIACDIVTLLCVYFIALHLWDEKVAFRAGLLFATAFSAAYFVLTKYDAFPTSLLMLAILFTVYGMKVRGYMAATLGFFAKIYPVIAFPFLILHNSKVTSLKDEVISVIKTVIPFFVVLFLPLAIIRPEVIKTYLFATGTSVGVYANTATYTLFAFLHDVIGLGISASTVSTGMYVLMGIVFLVLLSTAFMDTEKKPEILLRLLLAAIFSLVLFTKFHSPQYIVWFTPLLCLLVADSPVKMILFYVTQVLAYIEFPLMFGQFYTNLEYTNLAGSPGFFLTLIFFTVEYAALVVLMYMAVQPLEFLDIIKKRLGKS